MEDGKAAQLPIWSKQFEVILKTGYFLFSIMMCMMPSGNNISCIISHHMNHRLRSGAALRTVALRQEGCGFNPQTWGFSVCSLR